MKNEYRCAWVTPTTKTANSRRFFYAHKENLLPTSILNTQVPITVLVACAVVFGGYWVNANDSDISTNTKEIGEVRSLTAKNARHIQELSSAVQRLADREERVERDVEKLSKTSAETKELLIRIATKLEVDSD